MVKYLVLLLAGILAASCIFDADQCVMSADEPHNIMFTVSLQGHTKAPWSEEYPSENGVPFDNRILPDEMRVVILANDNTRLGTIEDLYYWPINQEQTEFQFTGQMPDAFVEHFNANGTTEPHYKFMVLANCSDNMSGEEYISYNYSQLDPSKEDSAIPMWGVKTVDLTSLLTTDTQDLGVIWLLRAAAKIEVKLSDKMKENEDAEICSATLKYYNQTGYVLPYGAMTVSDTRNLDQENCMKIYRHAAVNLPFYKDEESGDYHVYVTEYDNRNYSGERNKISLEFDINGEKKYFEDAISFCQYSNGAPIAGSDYDIVRNHIYEFEILSIGGSSLTLNYKVADWDAEDWGDGMDYEEHDLAYPTYHNPVVPKRYLELTPEQLNQFEITELPQMSYHANDPEAGAFECYFQIVAPVRDELWKPVFMGTKENYRIRVYDHKDFLLFETGTKEPAMGVCATNNEWFRIVVYPLSADGAGKDEIEFGITYHQMWTDQWINLYVNGEYDHIRWPQSGSNPKVINISHIIAGSE